MEGGADSKLHRYLSEVGIRSKVIGRIDFNPVDLDRALEAIVADGDNFLLERLYSYAKPGLEFVLDVSLDSPAGEPDMSGWSEDQREDYKFNHEIIYQEGEWHSPMRCYNLETNRVEDFDPIAFHPLPESFVVLDHVQDYRRLYNQVRKAKSFGYRLVDVEIVQPEDILFHLNLSDSSRFHYFSYHHIKGSRKYFGHLIPELK